MMPIAPAPVAVAAVPSRASPSPSPVPQNVQQSTSVQQNGSNKRPLRAPVVAVAGAAGSQEMKRARVEKTVVTVDSALSFEERKLRLEERRVALEEERLAWEKQKAQQEGKERQALLDVLSTQGSLVTELLAHLRSTKMAMNTHGV